MDVDEPVNENVVNNSAQPSLGKTNILKDVELDVETSSVQKDKHDKGSGIPIEDESGLNTALEKGCPF